MSNELKNVLEAILLTILAFLFFPGAFCLLTLEPFFVQNVHPLIIIGSALATLFLSMCLGTIASRVFVGDEKRTFLR